MLPNVADWHPTSANMDTPNTPARRLIAVELRPPPIKVVLAVYVIVYGFLSQFTKCLGSGNIRQNGFLEREPNIDVFIS